MRNNVDIEMENIEEEYKKLEDLIYASSDIKQLESLKNKLETDKQRITTEIKEDVIFLISAQTTAPNLIPQIEANNALNLARASHIESCIEYIEGKIVMLAGLQDESQNLNTQSNSTAINHPQPDKSWVGRFTKSTGEGVSRKGLLLGSSRLGQPSESKERTGSAPTGVQSTHTLSSQLPQQNVTTTTNPSPPHLRATTLSNIGVSGRKQTIALEDQQEALIKRLITKLSSDKHRDKDAKEIANDIVSLSSTLFSQIDIASIKGAGGSLENQDRAAVFKAQNPSLYHFINFSDHLYSACLQNIKNAPDDSEKQKRIRAWFEVAEELKKNNDFNGHFQIAAALFDIPELKSVNKIRSKLEKSDENSLKVFESYKDPFDNTFFNDQKKVLKSDLPIVPSVMVLRKIFAEAKGKNEAEFTTDFINTKAHLIDSKIESTKSKITTLEKELEGKSDSKKPDILEKRVMLNQHYNELCEYQQSKISVLEDLSQLTKTTEDKQKAYFNQQDLIRTKLKILESQQSNLSELHSAAMNENLKSSPIDKNKLISELRQNSMRVSAAKSNLVSIDHARTLLRIQNLKTDADVKLEMLEITNAYNKLMKAEATIKSPTAAEDFKRSILNLKDVTEAILKKPNLQNSVERREIEAIKQKLTEKLDLKDIKNIHLIETLHTKPS